MSSLMFSPPRPFSPRVVIVPSVPIAVSSVPIWVAVRVMTAPLRNRPLTYALSGEPGKRFKVALLTWVNHTSTTTVTTSTFFDSKLVIHRGMRERLISFPKSVMVLPFMVSENASGVKLYKLMVSPLSRHQHQYQPHGSHPYGKYECATVPIYGPHDLNH